MLGKFDEIPNGSVKEMPAAGGGMAQVRLAALGVKENEPSALKLERTTSGVGEFTSDHGIVFRIAVVAEHPRPGHSQRLIGADGVTVGLRSWLHIVGIHDRDLHRETLCRRAARIPVTHLCCHILCAGLIGGGRPGNEPGGGNNRHARGEGRQ